MRAEGGPRAWQAVDLGEAHQGEVRALFTEVFGQPMPEALWQWKYGGGRGRATGARDATTGALLAHYGGTQRVLHCAGQRLNAVQLGDVMVRAGARGVLSRNGPFAVATRRFLDSHVGQGQEFACGFGFPSARHVRLGELLGLYQGTDAVLQVTWPALDAERGRQVRARWRTRAVHWADGAGSARRLDALWLRLRDSALARQWVLGERDARWWRHRYANHPQGGYQCLWVTSRWTRRLLGAVALRPAQDGGPCELLDWLCAPGDLQAVLSAAWAHGATPGAPGAPGAAPAPAFLAWLSAPLWEQVRLAAPALAEGAAQPACLAAVTVRRGPDAQALLQGRPWWLTGGDTDFR